jgi:hypothetical protein
MARSEFPEWQRLADALAELTRVCGARGGYVLDSGANLWCAGDDLSPDGDSSSVMALTRVELDSLPTPLKRGGRLDLGRDSTYFRSFAGIYVLVLRFAGPMELGTVRAAVNARLRRIEGLTLSLPPPDGPGSSGAEGVGSA